MVRPQPAFPDLQGTAVVTDRIRVLPTGRGKPRHVGECPRRLHIVGTEGSLGQSQGLMERTLGIGQHPPFPERSALTDQPGDLGSDVLWSVWIGGLGPRTLVVHEITSSSRDTRVRTSGS